MGSEGRPFPAPVSTNEHTAPCSVQGALGAGLAEKNLRVRPREEMLRSGDETFGIPLMVELQHRLAVLLRVHTDEEAAGLRSS